MGPAVGPVLWHKDGAWVLDEKPHPDLKGCVALYRVWFIGSRETVTLIRYTLFANAIGMELTGLYCTQ